jgi:hypothetical protein
MTAYQVMMVVEKAFECATINYESKASLGRCILCMWAILMVLAREEVANPV